METIASRQNSLVKTFRALARGRRDGPDRLLLEGEHLVREALLAGVRITAAALASRMVARNAEAGRTIDRLAEDLTAAGTRVVSVSEDVMAAMSPVQAPSGIVALAEFRPPPLDAVLEASDLCVALLVGVQDPGNLGAVVRTAEASGATGLIACEPSADPFSWKALRGSMGSAFRLPVPERMPLASALLAVRRRGLWIAAAVPRGGAPMYGVDLRRPLALLLGGEGAGLPRDILDQADERISIPMQPPVESLNVAVSAALLLYEVARQRATFSRL